MQPEADAKIATPSHSVADGDKACIRELIERWVILRDMGDWDRLRAIWHPDGAMAASWREGSAEEFIAANRAAWNKGLDILHLLGGSLITLSDTHGRAISLTKMQISQRAMIHGVLCDATAQARHFDLWDKRNEQWGLVERRTIFDRDRLDTVVSGAVVQLDAQVLATFPPSYQHLAYLQTSMGFPVRTDLPHLRGAAAEELSRYGEEWLAGGARRAVG